jgi:hypothetical protein
MEVMIVWCGCVTKCVQAVNAFAHEQGGRALVRETQGPGLMEASLELVRICQYPCASSHKSSRVVYLPNHAYYLNTDVYLHL